MDFVNNPVATVTVKLDMTAKGNIAQSGDTVVASKQHGIAGISKNANLAQYAKVADTFYTKIGGGSYDSLSAVRTVKEGVA